MPIRIFELACVVVVIATLAATARRTPPRALAIDYALLAIAAWLGEESCVAIYRFYAYGAQWDARLVDVPILVPLIWPLVILSARDVATGLFPRASAIARAIAVFVIVSFDASMVEVVAVRAGLWSWAERGHFEVPLIGILGWGYFALGADLVLGRARGLAKLAVLALAPLTAHALIQATWWGLFRWTLRGELGRASLAGFVAIAGAMSALAIARRRRGDGIPFAVAAPRVFAAGLFFVLLLRTARGDLGLWTQVACVAITYSIATRWRQARPRAPADGGPRPAGRG